MRGKLLTRDQFRQQVTHRFLTCCVPGCQETELDAHHILNRNLFTSEGEQGGYFLDNGAGLCSTHHLQAELTLITTQELYKYCDITVPCLPATFDEGKEYDTWGNVVLSPYSRIKGPMFYDEGCQKALKKAGVLWQFMEEGD